MSKGLEKRKLASDVLDYLDDDSVSISKDNEIKKVPVDQLVPFHNHPFKLYEGQNVKTLVHEMAHQKLHAVENMDKELKLTRSAKEVEAESIAYPVYGTKIWPVLCGGSEKRTYRRTGE